MRCQPNWVFTGWESSPVSRANAALSNGATVAPCCAVNLPPSFFEASSVENWRASFAKFAPPSSWARSWSAFAFDLTTMWRTSREAGVSNCASFSS